MTRWLRFNRSRRAEIDGDTVPDRNVEYLFYQTLVGVWPPGSIPATMTGVKELADRVAAYMIKAVREGKESSSWSNPDAAIVGRSTGVHGGLCWRRLPAPP